MIHELLAPAGNIEAGYAALYYGADAVYLGLTQFSARAGAENFSFEDLDTFTAYAHSLNRKVFVALNTILSEEETEQLPQIFQALDKAKVDALIIQDLGVFYLAKKLVPNIELHASTQMAVHNAEGTKFLHSLGFKRVVLARELTLDEIQKIAKAVPDVDLEVFVHGALCYSYSGQCLFSALEYGKSANRGRCAYPCRAEFDVCEKGKEQETLRTHLFSMKDLALEENVRQIPALSLKIEGRKKSPLYVAAVTNYYRHLLDGKKKNLTEAEDIKQIFSRPWCHFHFDGKDKDIVDRNFVGHRGLVIGQVEKVGKNRLTFKTKHQLARYDGLQIDVLGEEKPFGFGVKGLFVQGKPQFQAASGDVVEVELPMERPRLQIGAPIYLASSSEVKGRYDYDKPKAGAYRNLTVLAVTVEVSATQVWAMCDDFNDVSVSLEGKFDVAKDADKATNSILAAFEKTGGTPFQIMLTVRNPEKRFVPMSMLNELRRQILEMAGRRVHELNMTTTAYDLPKVVAWAEKGGDKIEQPHLCFLSLSSKVQDFSDDEVAQAWFVLPQICRKTTLLAEIVRGLYARGARRFVAENYYAFELLKPYKDVEIAAGSFIYLMNRFASKVLADIGVVWAVPALESSPENMRQLALHAALPLVQVVEAFPPLFTSAVCIRANKCQDCKGGVKRYVLHKDGRKFEAVSHDCQVQVFDSKPYVREAIPEMAAYISLSKPFVAI